MRFVVVVMVAVGGCREVSDDDVECCARCQGVHRRGVPCPATMQVANQNHDCCRVEILNLTCHR